MNVVERLGENNISCLISLSERIGWDYSLEEIIQIDEDAFGTNREEFLKCRIIQSEQCIVIKDIQQNVLGRIWYEHTNARI